MNKASYEIFREESCGSTCEHRRALDTDIEFRPLVVTEYADPSVLQSLPPANLIIKEESIPLCAPIAFFGNKVTDEGIFDMDINLGRMLMPSFYTLHQLGKNMYVYDVAKCPSAVTFTR